jgi:hypothetical protein
MLAVQMWSSIGILKGRRVLGLLSISGFTVFIQVMRISRRGGLAMKIKALVASSVVCLSSQFLLTGCVMQHSVKSESKYGSIIGGEYTTIKDLFVVQSQGGYYFLVGERDKGILADQMPTFEEFRDHGRIGAKFGGLKIMEILPAGSIIVLDDVLLNRNFELGSTIEMYGVIKKPASHSKYKPLFLGGHFAEEKNSARIHGATLDPGKYIKH